MLPQIVNIIAGFLLAVPKIMELGVAKNAIKKIESRLRPFEGIIGWVVLILGVGMLIERITFMPIFYRYYYISGGFAQSIPAILMGLILLADFFRKHKDLDHFIKQIEPYKIWIGFWGITAGFISILSGCAFLC